MKFGSAWLKRTYAIEKHASGGFQISLVKFRTWYPDIHKDFSESNTLQFEPAQLTESGMRCFERFFNTVNYSKEGKLHQKTRDYQAGYLDLIATAYLWRCLWR